MSLASPIVKRGLCRPVGWGQKGLIAGGEGPGPCCEREASWVQGAQHCRGAGHTQSSRPERALRLGGGWCLRGTLGSQTPT